jgi:hypothetical protein
MSILDPVESKRIQDLLEENQSFAAAQIIIQSKYQEHKSMRPLVTECIDQLMEAAKSAFDNNNLDTAHGHASLANQCRPLSSFHAELLSEIDSVITKRNRSHQWEQELLEQARKGAEAGSVHTTIERLKPISHLTEAKQLHEEMESKLKTMERYYQECKDFLDQDNYKDAFLILKKLKMICPQSASILQLEKEISDVKKKSEPEIEEIDENDLGLIHSDGKGFVLDFGNAEFNTLVLFGNTFIIGAPAKSGTTADIPINPAHLLHRQQVVLFRHLRGDAMTYWLLPHPSHANDTYTAINGVELERGVISEQKKMMGCQELKNGDIIQIGTDKNNIPIQFLFRQREVNQNNPDDDEIKKLQSKTAVLELMKPSSRSNNTLQPEIIINGIRCHRTVLMFDSLTLSGNPQRGDLVFNSILDKVVEYSSKSGVLMCLVDNGQSDLRDAKDDWIDDNKVRINSSLILKKTPEEKGDRIIHKSI